MLTRQLSIHLLKFQNVKAAGVYISKKTEKLSNMNKLKKKQNRIEMTYRTGGTCMYIYKTTRKAEDFASSLAERNMTRELTASHDR